jgi:hypothetical protein
MYIIVSSYYTTAGLRKGMPFISYSHTHIDTELTFSNLFLKMGVNLGSRFLMAGIIFIIPTTFTIAFSAPRMLPGTSGYSHPDIHITQHPSAVPAIQTNPISKEEFELNILY